MREMTCVVIGGGYAGIHAVKAIQKSLREKSGKGTVRIVLIDKNPYHLRKVLLFKPAAGDHDIKIPLIQLFPEEVEIIQAAVTAVETGVKRLLYQDADGNEHAMNYDILVLAAGSVVRQPDSEQGGIALTGLETAMKIRAAWRMNLTKAAGETNDEERRRLMTVAVAGAGISGIETSAELAYSVRADAKALGLDPDDVTVRLFNAHDRLFSQGPAKVGHKLEQLLSASGVTVSHRSKVMQEKDGKLILSDGKTAPAGLCVWTLGLAPSPMLSRIGLPLTPDGYVAVDASYRVQGSPGVYSIGDCAQIVDPASGQADGKTCKEATAQAARLGKIVLADMEGRPAPSHKSFMDFFCFGLGPEQGIVWTRQWGLDLIFTGRLGWQIRKYTWDIASLLK